MVFKSWEVEQIVGVYERSNGNASRAARMMKEEGLQITSVSVLNYWKKKDLPIRGRGGRHVEQRKGDKFLSDQQIDRIVDGFEQHEGNPGKCAAEFGVDPSTIRKYWRSAGLKPVNQNILKPEEQQKIYDAYEKSGHSISVAAHLTKRARSTVRRYWEKKGLQYIARSDQHHITIDRLM